MSSIRPAVLALVLFALSLFAIPLAAQTCVGVPLSRGNSSMAVGMNFPDNANSFSVSGRSAVTDLLVIGAGYNLTSFDESIFGELPNMHTVGIGAALPIDVSSSVGGSGLIGVCPTAELQFTSWKDNDGGLEMFSIPIGVGLGGAVPLGASDANLAPYINPMLVWSHASVDGFESETQTEFGVSGGANVFIRTIYFGAGFFKVGDSDVTFGIQAGLLF